MVALISSSASYCKRWKETTQDMHLLVKPNAKNALLLNYKYIMYKQASRFDVRMELPNTVRGEAR